MDLDKGLVTLFGMSLAYVASLAGMGLAWWSWRRRRGGRGGGGEGGDR